MEKYGFTKPMMCPHCNRQTTFDFTIFIFDEAGNDFIFSEIARSGNINRRTCTLCNNDVRLPNQFGYFSSKYDATILLANKDCHVEEMESYVNLCIKSFNEVSNNKLKPIISHKPFVLVKGWNGMYKFFSILRGEHFTVPQGEELTAIQMAYGYSYGEVFFHYPADFLLHTIIESTLKVSICYKHHHLFCDAIDFVAKMSKLLKHKNPELLKELGLLSILTKDNEEAKKYLTLAKECQFRWLAPTFSILDATPLRREDGETQDASLPHNIPILSRQKFTDTAHTVLKKFPVIADFGVCDFPYLEATCRERELPELSALLDIYSVLLGELYYLFYHHPINNKIHQAAYLIKEEFKKFLIENEAQIEMSFWCKFAKEAFRLSYGWPLPTSISSPEMTAFSKTAGEKMAKLQYERHQLEKQNEGNQDINSFICHNLELSINYLFRSLLKLIPSNQVKDAENSMFKGFYAFKMPGMTDVEIELDNES